MSKPEIDCLVTFLHRTLDMIKVQIYLYLEISVQMTITVDKYQTSVPMDTINGNQWSK